MILKKTICTIILSLGCSTCLLQAQQLGEIELFKKNYIRTVKPEHKFYRGLARDNKNEVQQLLSLAFLFYKEILSSQDVGVCNFTPSCSEYAIQSIKKKGLIFGTLASFDRLTRCNGLSPDLYPLHPETKRMYDPVE